METYFVPGLKNMAIAASYDWDQWFHVWDMLDEHLNEDTIAYEQLSKINRTDNILEECCYHNYEELISVFLANGFPINQSIRRLNFFNHHNLFILACCGGQLDLMKYLLSQGADIDAPCSYGLTALHYAVDKGYKEVVKFLIDRGANVYAQNDDNQTLLHTACMYSHLELIKTFLEMGFDVNATTNTLYSPLCYAANAGNIDCVKLLVEYGADINRKDVLPLYCASQGSHISVMEFLLDSGARINIPDKHGDVAIHVAAGYGNIESIKLLLNHNADINAIGQFGQTALQCSLTNWDQNLEVADFLIQNGADVNACAFYGKTILHCAVQGEASTDLLELLFENGANIDAKDNDNVTALYKLVFEHNPIGEEGEGILEDIINIAGRFIMWGANPNVTDSEGNTLLHWSAYVGSIHLVKYLIRCGLDINAKNKNGKKPIDLASQFGHDSVVVYIIDYYCYKFHDSD